jgi:hypothetical protein
LAHRRDRASPTEFEHIRRLEPSALRDLTRGQPTVLRHDRRRRDGVCEPKSQERLDARDLAEELRDRFAGNIGQAARVEQPEIGRQVGQRR